MKQINFQGFFLSFLFIILIYCFTRGYYSPFFWLILGLLLFLVFLKEKNRLFAWVMISFFGGNLILFYLDKFIEGYSVEPFFLLILNQVFYIVPILTIAYVIKQFNKSISFFFNKPETFDKGKYFNLILGLVSAGIILLFITNDVELDLKLVLALISFALIHSILQEVLWRGILFTQMIKVTNEKPAMLFSSTAFAVNTTIFGFSPIVFLLYLLLGYFFSFLTKKYKSILPAVFTHTFVLIFLFLTGWLHLPI